MPRGKGKVKLVQQQKKEDAQWEQMMRMHVLHQYFQSGLIHGEHDPMFMPRDSGDSEDEEDEPFTEEMLEFVNDLMNEQPEIYHPYVKDVYFFMRFLTNEPDLLWKCNAQIRISLMSPLVFGIPMMQSEDILKWACVKRVIPRKYVDDLKLDDPIPDLVIVMAECMTTISRNLLRRYSADTTVLLKILFHIGEWYRFRHESSDHRMNNKYNLEPLKQEIRQLHLLSEVRSDSTYSGRNYSKVLCTEMLENMMVFACHQLAFFLINNEYKKFSTLADIELAATNVEKIKIEANEKFKSNEYFDAILDYTRALRFAPFHHVIYANRAMAWLKFSDLDVKSKRKHCEMALSDAFRAIAIRPSFAKAHYRYAKALSQLGREEDALRSIDDALKYKVNAAHLLSEEKDEKHEDQVSRLKRLFETLKANRQSSLNDEEEECYDEDEAYDDDNDSMWSEVGVDCEPPFKYLMHSDPREKDQTTQTTIDPNLKLKSQSYSSSTKCTNVNSTISSKKSTMNITNIKETLPLNMKPTIQPVSRSNSKTAAVNSKASDVRPKENRGKSIPIDPAFNFADREVLVNEKRFEFGVFSHVKGEQRKQMENLGLELKGKLNSHQKAESTKVKKRHLSGKSNTSAESESQTSRAEGTKINSNEREPKAPEGSTRAHNTTAAGKKGKGQQGNERKSGGNGQQRVKHTAPKDGKCCENEHCSARQTLANEEMEANIVKLNGYLQEASQALLDENYPFSSKMFDKCTAFIQEKTAEVLRKSHEDILVIRYARGLAYTSEKKESTLHSGIDLFKSIVDQNPNNTLKSLSGYGMALGNLYLFRHSQALVQAEETLTLTDAGLETVYLWPGTKKVIASTHSLKLKLKNIIEACKDAPQPEFVCCSHECSSPAIFFKDPTFKGMVTEICSEKCVVHFHPVCFKNSEFNKKHSAKNRLKMECPTPDCTGFICKHILTDADEIKHEESCEVPKNASPQVKLRKSSEKSLAKQAAKRQRKQEAIRRKREEEEAEQKRLADEEKSKRLAEEIKRKAETAELHHGKTFVVKVKEHDDSSHQTTKSSRQKHRENKHQDGKDSRRNPVGLFRGSFRQMEDFSDESDSENSTPRFREVPSHLQAENDRLTSALIGLSSNGLDGQELCYNLIRLYTDILKVSGPIAVDSKILTEVIEHEPEASNLVAQCGGISKFLIATQEFLTIGKLICVRSDFKKAMQITDDLRSITMGTGLVSADFKEQIEDAASYENPARRRIGADDVDNHEKSEYMEEFARSCASFVNDRPGPRYPDDDPPPLEESFHPLPTIQHSTFVDLTNFTPVFKPPIVVQVPLTETEPLPVLGESLPLDVEIPSNNVQSMEIPTERETLEKNVETTDVDAPPPLVVSQPTISQTPPSSPKLSDNVEDSDPLPDSNVMCPPSSTPPPPMLEPAGNVTSDDNKINEMSELTKSSTETEVAVQANDQPDTNIDSRPTSCDSGLYTTPRQTDSVNSQSTNSSSESDSDRPSSARSSEFAESQPPQLQQPAYFSVPVPTELAPNPLYQGYNQPHPYFTDLYNQAPAVGAPALVAGCDWSTPAMYPPMVYHQPVFQQYPAMSQPLDSRLAYSQNIQPQPTFRTCQNKTDAAVQTVNPQMVEGGCNTELNLMTEEEKDQLAYSDINSKYTKLLDKHTRFINTSSAKLKQKDAQIESLEGEVEESKKKLKSTEDASSKERSKWKAEQKTLTNERNSLKQRFDRFESDFVTKEKALEAQRDETRDQLEIARGQVTSINIQLEDYTKMSYKNKERAISAELQVLNVLRDFNLDELNRKLQETEKIIEGVTKEQLSYEARRTPPPPYLAAHSARIKDRFTLLLSLKDEQNKLYESQCHDVVTGTKTLRQLPTLSPPNFNAILERTESPVPSIPRQSNGLMHPGMNPAMMRQLPTGTVMQSQQMHPMLVRPGSPHTMPSQSGRNSSPGPPPLQLRRGSDTAANIRSQSPSSAVTKPNQSQAAKPQGQSSNGPSQQEIMMVVINHISEIFPARSHDQIRKDIADLRQQRGGFNGLKLSELKQILVQHITEQPRSSSRTRDSPRQVRDNECSICQDPMNSSMNASIKTLSCSHRFHQQCINVWLEDNKTCPNCRSSQ